MTYLIPPPAAGGGLPSGTVTAFAGSSAPGDWLICDGSAVSRSTYADLFSAIGTTYGVGDGSTTFNIPDLRGRTIFGVGTHADVDALNDSDGIATVANRRPKHQHTVYQTSHSHTIVSHKISGPFVGLKNLTGDYGNAGNISTDAATVNIKVNPENASTSSSPLDAPAYLVLNYIIKT